MESSSQRFVEKNDFVSVSYSIINYMTRNIHYRPGIDYSAGHSPSKPHHVPGLAFPHSGMQPSAQEFWTLAKNLNLFDAF
jgi:hypothetical protein